MTDIKAKGGMKGSLEPSILNQIANYLSEVKGQNNYLGVGIALTKQSMAYLSGQNKDLQDPLYQANSVNSGSNTFLKNPPQPVASYGDVVHE